MLRKLGEEAKGQLPLTPSPHNYHKSIPQKFFLDMGQGIF